VAFVGSPLPDGAIADGNYLWLSDWYRENLNAFFTAPLDYALWRHLDAALRLLAATRIISRADWAESQQGLAQLHLYRGERLLVPGRGEPAFVATLSDDLIGTMAVKELRNLKPAEWGLVADFYRLWTGTSHARPTPRELAQAREVIVAHGEAKAKRLIPLVVKRLKERWPEAKTLGAMAKYLPDASEEYEQKERIAQREKEQHLREQMEQDKQEQHRLAQQQLLGKWRPAWQTLPDEDRQRVECYWSEHPLFSPCTRYARISSHSSRFSDSGCRPLNLPPYIRLVQATRTGPSWAMYPRHYFIPLSPSASQSKSQAFTRATPIACR